MDSNRLQVKRNSLSKGEVPPLMLHKQPVDNIILKDKTGQEILKILKVSFH